MESEELSAEFISQKENLADIYKLIVKAAQNTLPPDDSDSKFLVEFNSDKSRFTPRNVRNNAAKDIKIAYDSQNICITGGSALNIYDLALEEYRKRKTITPLKEFVNRSTPDIDIVWWPTVTGSDSNKYAVISVSPIIHNFVIRLEKQLDESFSYLIGKQYRVFDTIYTVNRVKISNNFADSGQRPAGYKYGTHQLKISIQINDTLVHIVDFSIYDSASGQTKPQQSLLPMNTDPVYMNQSTIKSLQIHDIHVNVPEIKHLIKQQIFAFNNIYPINPTKGMVIYKRILYIKELINKANSRNNIRDIHSVLGNIGNIPIKSITDTLNKNSINSLENVSRVIEEEIASSVPPTSIVTNKPQKNKKAIQEQLKELDIEYQAKLLALKAPVREAKRKHQNIKAAERAIQPQLKELENKYLSIINKLKIELEEFSSNNIESSTIPLNTPIPTTTPTTIPTPTTRLPTDTRMQSRRQPIMQVLPFRIIEEYYNDAGQFIALVYDNIRHQQYEVFIEILPTGQKRLRMDISVLRTVREYMDAQGNYNYLIFDPSDGNYIHRIINSYTKQVIWNKKISPYDYARLIGSIRR